MISGLSRRTFLHVGAAASAGALLTPTLAGARSRARRKTPSLDLDVLVVGGGISALVIARRLQSQGYSVALVDRSLGNRRSCTGDGYVEGGYAYHEDPGFAGLVRDARTQWEALLSDVAPRIRRSTSVYGFDSPDALRARAAVWERAGKRMPFEECAMPRELSDGAIRHAVRTDEYDVSCHDLIRELATSDLAMSRIGNVERIRMSSDSSQVQAVELSIAGRNVTIEPKALVLAAGLWNFKLLELLTVNSPALRATVRGYQAMRRVFELVIHGALPHFTGFFPNANGLLIRSRERNGDVVWRVTDNRPARLSERDDAATFDEKWWLPPVIRALEGIAPSVLARRDAYRWGIHSVTRAELSAGQVEPRVATTDAVHRFGLKNLWAVWPTDLVFTPFSVQSVSTGISQTVRAVGNRPPRSWNEWREPMRHAAPLWEDAQLIEWNGFEREVVTRSPRSQQAVASR